MRFVFELLLLASLLLPHLLLGQGELTGLIQQLRHEIQDASLVNAAETAERLDAAVQTSYRAWLVRDANERADEVLSWLPPDVEGFWVNKRPIVASPEPDTFDQSAIDSYLFDRLYGQNDGDYAKRLRGHMVRMVIAAVRGVPHPEFDMVSMPAPVTARDVIYFYFLTGPLEFPNPDEVAQGFSLWRSTGQVVGHYIPQPGVRPTPHEDTNWIAFPRPGLLILSSQKNLLVSVLGRMSGGQAARALPVGLPEWQQVDRSADFWGLRHFGAESKPKPGERGCDIAELPFPDCRAVGATFQLGRAKQIDIRYLSSATVKPLFPERIAISRTQTSVWKLDVAGEANDPVRTGFALAMLGFGVYR